MHITPNSLTAGITGVPYNQIFTAYDYRGNVTFSENGNFPAGLTLTPDGIMSGTPLAAGSYVFNIVATDRFCDDGSEIFSQTYFMTIISGNINPVVIRPTFMPAGRVGISYTQDFFVTGGVGTLTISECGSLPTGLTLALDGIPSEAGTWVISIIGNDASGDSATQTYTITVNTIPSDGLNDDAMNVIAINA